MHILIMSVWYPNNQDSLHGIVVKRFAELLTREYEVTVIHTISDSKQHRVIINDEKTNNVRTIIAQHPKGFSDFGKWWYQRCALRACLKKIEDVDLIFGHGFYPKGFQYVKAKRYFHCSLVIMEHSSTFGGKIGRRFLSWQKTQMRTISASVKKIITVSEVLKIDMKNTFPTTKIEIIPNFVYREAFPFRSELPKKYTNFIHISSLNEKHKNPLLLFESFAAAILLNPEIRLTIVSNKNTEKWVQWCADFKLLDKINFIGFASSQDIANLLLDNDCLIHTSNYESFGLGLAEAWMTGTPILSTPVGVAKNMPLSLGVLAKSKEEFCKEILLFSQGEYEFNPQEIHAHALQFCDDTVLSQLKSLFENYFEDRD